MRELQRWMRQPDDPGGSFSRLCLCCGKRQARTRDVLCDDCEPESWWMHLLRRVRSVVR